MPDLDIEVGDLVQLMYEPLHSEKKHIIIGHIEEIHPNGSSLDPEAEYIVTLREEDTEDIFVCCWVISEFGSEIDKVERKGSDDVLGTMLDFSVIISGDKD